MHLASTSAGQELKKTRDMALWVGVEGVYKFKKKYELKFGQEIRFFEDVSVMEKYITDLSLKYKINKKFSLAGGLRYFVDRDKDFSTTDKFRYHMDLAYRKKILKRFRIKYRLRFQSVYKNLDRADTKASASNVRNKLALEYKLNKKHSLQLSQELFRKIVSFQRPYFNKVRFTLKDKIKTRFGRSTVGIGYERELESDYPLNYFMVLLYHSINIKK